MSNYKFGLFGEGVVSLLYRLKLYKILSRRFKAKFGEIDLICSRFNTLVFVEVKSRSGDYDDVLCSSYQQQRIRRAAEYFLLTRPCYMSYNVRFDFALVRPYRLPLLIKGFM